MSIQLIQQYHAKVEKIIRYGGSRNESALRKLFQDWLGRVCAATVQTMKVIGEMPG